MITGHTCAHIQQFHKYFSSTAELDRPKFTLEVSEGSATLNVTDSPTAIANGQHLQTLRDIFSEQLHYRVTYWKNKSTGKVRSTHHRLTSQQQSLTYVNDITGLSLLLSTENIQLQHKYDKGDWPGSRGELLLPGPSLHPQPHLWQAAGRPESPAVLKRREPDHHRR